MALLNYAALVSDLEKIKSGYSNLNNLSTWDASDKIKLILTGDKHIITHGVDLLSDYSNGIRGLVPDYTSLNNNLVLGKTGWVDITTNMLPDITIDKLPISENGISGDDTTHIPTNDLIVKYIGNSIRAAETLRFMGGIGYNANTNSYYYIPVNGTETSGFPKDCKVGDSYRILTANTTIAGAVQLVGDIVICIKDTKDATTLDETSSTYWLVVQANIQGTSEVSINGTPYNIYTSSIVTTAKSIYAPSSKGSSGNILISKGNNTPVWGALSTNNGYFTINDGTDDIIKSEIIANSANTANTANSVKQKLLVSTGLSFVELGNSYNGSVEKTLVLKPATTSTLGGVIIDDGIKEGDTTPHPTISIDSGKIYLTQENIVNALGFMPSDPSGMVSYTAGAGIDLTNLVISLVKSTSSELGGIKVGYTTVDKNYAVLLDGNGNAYVNVPWKGREIKIGGSSIGESTINFVPTGDIYIKTDNNNNNMVDLSFGLSWYNISEEEYEYDSSVYL